MAERALTRRSFVSSLGRTAGAALVVGFDPLSRSWVTSLAQSQLPVEELPRLDGVLLTEGAALDAAADDRGHIVHHRPAAVLRPGSIADVMRMVRFASQRGLRLAMRGQGHSHYGHAQVAGGLVIDSSTLDRVERPTDRTVDAAPGASWAQVTDATLADGLTPPVLPDVMMLTVGGTLSAGGLGATSQHHGAVVDNVEELDIVTADGRLVTCSLARERELFEMTLAGMGQCGFIVRARLRLVPAPRTVTLWELTYSGRRPFLQDHERLAHDGRFAHQYGWLQRTENGWQPVIQAGLFDVSEETPLPRRQLVFASASKPTRTTYREYLHRLAAFVEQASRRPDWLNPRPSVTLFLARDATAAFLDRVVENSEETDGIWRFDVCPFVRRRFSRPLLRMPDADIVFSLWMFRTAPDRNPVTVQRMLATSRTLLERTLDARGTPYAPYFDGTPEAWRRVLGDDLWRRLSKAKRQFDPKSVLTPGARIFA